MALRAPVRRSHRTVPHTAAQRSAAEKLGRIYSIMANLRLVAFDEWIPSGPRGRPDPPGTLRSALTFVYGGPAARGYADLSVLYRNTYDTVMPSVKANALRFATEALRNEELALRHFQWRLRTETGLAARLHTSADRVGRRAGGFGEVGEEEQRYGLDLSHEYVDIKDPKKLDELQRTRFLPAVQKEKDRDLSTLFLHPRGMSIVRAYNQGATEGTELASSLIDEARTAVVEFREKLNEPGNEDHVMRYPFMVVGGLARLGLLQVPGFKEYCVGVGQVLGQSVLKRWVDGAALAVGCLAIVFAGPGAFAVVLAVADVALAGLGTTLEFFREREQELGAAGSVLRPDAEKFAASSGYEDTLMASAAMLLSGLAFYGAVKEFRQLRQARALTVSQALRTAEHAHPPGAAAAADYRGLPPSKPDGAALSAQEKGLAQTGPGTPSASGVPARPADGTSPAAEATSQMRDLSPDTRSVGADATATDKGPPKAVGKPARPPGPDVASAEEVSKARDELATQLRQLEAAGLKKPPLKDFYLTDVQKETFGRLVDTVLPSGQRAVPSALNTERAAALARAEARAMNLRGRLAAHWDAALPRRGKQTAAEAAYDLLQDVKKTVPTGSQANDAIREAFFDNWRDRFFRRVAKDEDLLIDLEVQAGILLEHEPGRVAGKFQVRGQDEAGNIVLVDLNLDHAVIRHQDAVLAALRTNDSAFLESTVAANNLQLMTGRENQYVIEALRKQAAEGWTVKPGPTPRAIQPFTYGD